LFDFLRCFEASGIKASERVVAVSFGHAFEKVRKIGGVSEDFPKSTRIRPHEYWV
jgi:hypothetical protein